MPLQYDGEQLEHSRCRRLQRQCTAVHASIADSARRVSIKLGERAACYSLEANTAVLFVSSFQAVTDVLFQASAEKAIPL